MGLIVTEVARAHWVLHGLPAMPEFMAYMLAVRYLGRSHEDKVRLTSIWKQFVKVARQHHGQGAYPGVISEDSANVYSDGMVTTYTVAAWVDLGTPESMPQIGGS